MPVSKRNVRKITAACNRHMHWSGLVIGCPVTQLSIIIPAPHPQSPIWGTNIAHGGPSLRPILGTRTFLAASVQRGGEIAIREGPIQLRKIAKKLRCHNQASRSLTEQHFCTGASECLSVSSNMVHRGIQFINYIPKAGVVLHDVPNAKQLMGSAQPPFCLSPNGLQNSACKGHQQGCRLWGKK